MAIPQDCVLYYCDSAHAGGFCGCGTTVDGSLFLLGKVKISGLHNMFSICTNVLIIAIGWELVEKV
jgi:hypothetical protein